MPQHPACAARREHESIIVAARAKARNHGIRQRHCMVTLRFHPLARHNPHPVGKVELAPACAQRFLATDSGEDHEFEGAMFDAIAKRRHKPGSVLCRHGRPGLHLGDLLGRQLAKPRPGRWVRFHALRGQDGFNETA